MSRAKDITTMTTEEMKDYLKELSDKVINFKDSKVGTRQDRSYANQKRGNFQGNHMKTARRNLKVLGETVNMESIKDD